MDEEKFETLATHCDMFDRLSLTLSQPDIDQSVTAATVLQLAGGVPKERDLGADVRGDIHLAVVAGASTNLSRYISTIADLAPNSHHLNGTNTTLAGALGSVKGGELTPGPLLDDSVEFTYLEKMDEMGSKTGSAVQQILDTSTYSFAKSTFRETVPASGSVTIAVNPKWGEWDEYAPIGEQLNLAPDVVSAVDLVVTNMAGKATPPAETLRTQDVDPLDPEVAREFLELARSKDPSITEDATGPIDEFVKQVEEFVEDRDDGQTVGSDRLKESIARLAEAHASLRLSESVSANDSKRAVQLVETVLADRGIDLEVGKFDADVVATGTSKAQRDRIKNLKHLVEELQPDGDFNSGAHIEDVISHASEIGLDASKAEHEIDKLKQKGEVWEPNTDELRTT